jgi:hypothetical protein
LTRGLIRGISFLFILLLIIGSSSATIGYSINAQVDGGPAFILSRETHNMTFSLDGSVSGSGNFSRFNRILDIAGINSNEQTSAVRGGDLSIDEKQRIQTLEGPVSITIELASATEYISIPDPINPSNFILVPVIKESAQIDTDEVWPAAYANYKKISYRGPKVHNKDFYDNNGDMITSSIDSWKLNKEGLYRTSLNRTLIHADLTQTQLLVNKALNRTSFYALNMDSTGSLTHLGIARMDSSDSSSKGITPKKPDAFISEDYVGQQTIKLKISMNDYVILNREEDAWLPCCSGGYSDLRKSDKKGLSSDSIFNCSCASLSPMY